MIGFILLQQGKGADAGASFGAGASNTMFGPRGRTNPLSRATKVCAVLFMMLGLVIANLERRGTAVSDDSWLPTDPVTTQEGALAPNAEPAELALPGEE